MWTTNSGEDIYFYNYRVTLSGSILKLIWFSTVTKLKRNLTVCKSLLKRISVMNAQTMPNGDKLRRAKNLPTKSPAKNWHIIITTRLIYFWLPRKFSPFGYSTYVSFTGTHCVSESIDMLKIRIFHSRSSSTTGKRQNQLNCIQMKAREAILK